MINAPNEGRRYVSANTNLLLKATTATERIVVWSAVATCGGGNSGDVSMQLGFGASGVPTVTVDSGTGTVGICASHPGIPRGGGFVWGGGSEPIGVGAPGEDLWLNNSAADDYFDLVLKIEVEDVAPVG